MTAYINQNLLIFNIKRNDTKSIIENIDLIQIISAYCQISDQKSTKHLEFDKIASFVKVMTQNVLNKDGPSVLSRLYGLFSERLDSAEGKSGNYSISDLVVLLIYFYSLVGEDCFYGIEEEDRIKVHFNSVFKLNSDSYYIYSNRLIIN